MSEACSGQNTILPAHPHMFAHKALDSLAQ